MNTPFYSILTSILVATSMGACKSSPEDSSSLNTNNQDAYSERAQAATITSYDSDDLLGDIEKHINEQSPLGIASGDFRSFTIDPEDLAKLETSEEEPIGWPPLPRRMLNMERSSGWDQAIHFGIKGSFFDLVEANAGGNLSVAATTSKTLTLVKNTPTNQEDLLREVEVEWTQELADDLRIPYTGTYSPEETIKLQRPYVEDGYEYVAFCTYKSSISNGTRLEGYVKLSGNGPSGGYAWSEDISLTQMSSFFRVTADDSIRSLQNLCQDVYHLQVKDSVKRDLARVMATGTMDTSSVNAESRAITAALYGPTIERINVYNHHWNIYKVRIDNSQKGIVKVEGEIKHNVRAQRDDSIYFKCTHDHGNRTQYETRVAQRSATTGYRDAGRRLIDKICYDAFIDFAKD